DQVFCRLTIFPCQKIDDRANANLGPQSGENSPARSAAPLSPLARLVSTTIRTLMPRAFVAQSSADGARWSAIQHTQVPASEEACNGRARLCRDEVQDQFQALRASLTCASAANRSYEMAMSSIVFL